MATETRNIVILGASFAGLSAAHYTLKHTIPTLPKDINYRIVLIAPNENFYFRVAGPRSIVSDKLLDPKKVFLPIAPGFKQYGDKHFEQIIGTATSVDTVGRTVTFETKGATEASKTIPYHALVIATGARSADPIFSLQPGQGDDEVRQAHLNFQKKLSSAKSVLIVGGGPAGVEAAGEIGEEYNGRAGFFQKRPKNIKMKVTLVSAEKKLLPVLRPAIAKQAEDFLGEVGVDVEYGMRMTESNENADGTTTVKFSNGKELTADVFVKAIGQTPNTEFLPAELKNEKGYVKSDTPSLRVSAAGPLVFAVGDVGSYTRGGVMDIFDALPVAMTNLKADLQKAATGGVDAVTAAKTGGNGKGDRPYKPNLKETQLVPIGRSKGVGAGFGYRFPSVMIWMIKGRDYLTSTADQTRMGTKWSKEETGWKPTDA